ncbi:MAG TPA: hypothetical protein VF766_00125, partial [Pyrinomonadaceae bacterium]
MRLQTQRPAPSPSTSQKKKGLAPLRKDEAPDGSRVTITYNEPLSDYSAYRSGNQFVVVIPKADAPRVSSGLRGRGFEGVQVEKRGDDTVLSFRIQPGVKARVAQQFNRLEVIFSAPGQTQAKAATVTQQATALASLTSQSKAAQSTQTSVGLPQTPPANHNTTGAQPDQTKNESVSVDSSAEPAVALTQPSATAPVTEQPSPLASPRTGLAAVSLLVTRHWLPCLIAALLVASAYVAIAARRRTERSSSSQHADARAELNEEVEARTKALRVENAAEIKSPVEEEPEAEVTESAAAQTNHIEVHDAKAAQILLSKEPEAVESGASRTPDTVFSGVSSAMASELAAALMDLPPPGSEDAFCKISAAFDHPSQQVRNAAARALFNFSPDRVASFKRIMQESSQERRRKIGAAIASSGMAMEAIRDLTSRSGEKAYEALLVLSLMAKAGEVKSLILTIEEHPSTEVRLALVKLLALSGQQEALTAFRRLATHDSLPIAVR